MLADERIVQLDIGIAGQRPQCVSDYVHDVFVARLGGGLEKIEDTLQSLPICLKTKILYVAYERVENEIVEPIANIVWVWFELGNYS